MIGQISRFAGIGVLATTLHVIVAIVAAEFFAVTPLLANSIGFFAAFSLSYLGHGRITFGTSLEHRYHAPRFLTVSAIGLVLSTALTELIAVQLGASFVLAMAVVAFAVPISTFFFCKFWVFARPYSTDP
ncbi:GtrA-like protein [Ruegeria denitrificans]|uniref:GtrA-like protein n=1 Tax=Ruegeria denitrificans TaxID=1715692 RepID=A0A0P1IJ43_9RHOB|nr:GtrA family protein [Ruegeria denitrificans]CUK15614.1 GtrA-like protein [Ruegeria denitrificans]